MLEVLPAPFGPRIPMHSPRGTAKENPLTATLGGLPSRAGYTRLRSSQMIEYALLGLVRNSSTNSVCGCTFYLHRDELVSSWRKNKRKKHHCYTDVNMSPLPMLCAKSPLVPRLGISRSTNKHPLRIDTLNWRWVYTHWVEFKPTFNQNWYNSIFSHLHTTTLVLEEWIQSQLIDTLIGEIRGVETTNLRILVERLSMINLLLPNLLRVPHGNYKQNRTKESKLQPSLLGK